MILKRKKIYLTAMFGLLWVTELAFGLRTLLNYEGTPGTLATLPTNWPAQSAIKLSPDKPTLLVFAHPHCPCTQVGASRGVTVRTDLDGAETSGQTELFAAHWRLLFSGGITQSRGHAGGNAGESAIVSLVNHGRGDRARTLVFGCSLAGHLTTAPKRLCLN